MLVIEDDSSLLAPSSINEPEHKETLVLTERPESTTEVTSVKVFNYPRLLDWTKRLRAYNL